ncbi:hypothetical protein [Agromyces albus]|uniref:hypothetical protein n=1 Tax=Agromyces albus TaxID=205332 RepID=UPI0027836854|nr:hypothetical protein [Agromyces albus]MDQ0576456.1 hypothetical protein [Agromyces albus]
MTDRVLTIPTDPPAMVIAGSPDDYGSLDVGSIRLAAEFAGNAFRRAEELTENPDDIASLRAAVNELSDGLNTVVGQLYQIAHGLATGRLAVTQAD